MIFTFRCPACQHEFQVNHADLVQGAAALKCQACGDAPAPDIQTAYQNIGKSLTELYGCCQNEDKQRWLPLGARR
ncbi:MAG TPA: MJ0042-type zinc finger domain-containing protein [Negativicutes bacterium]|nr:MJ0042-type zinc finger domain-containing protein [Negativicutes bacterium]